MDGPNNVVEDLYINWYVDINTFSYRQKFVPKYLIFKHFFRKMFNTFNLIHLIFLIHINLIYFILGTCCQRTQKKKG